MNVLKETVTNQEIPYYPFPDDPETIEVGGFSVYEYLSPGIIADRMKTMSQEITMGAFDVVLVNMQGGVFLFEQLASLSKYQADPVLIEYHRPDNGFGAIITTPVPQGLKNSKALVVDDIHDSGGVMAEIMKNLSPESEAVALVTKRGIQNQIQVPKLHIGLSIDNKWIGGCGMDLGVENEGNIFRSYPGIIVKK